MRIFTLSTIVLFTIMMGVQLDAQRIGDLNGINYQAVAVDEDGKEIVGMDIEGKPLFEKEIGVRFTIQKGQDGEIQYQETHSALTDQYGLFSLTIGHGEQTGQGAYTDLLSIPWIDADQWLQVEISIENNGDYKIVSMQQFMSVPYSFYTDDIADDAITTEKILNEEILAEDIATGAVATDEILDETILAEDIATGAVTTDEVLDETILAEDIDTGAVTTNEILDETIVAEDISTGAVATDEILDGTLLNEDVADGTIDLSAKVQDTLPVANGGTGLGVVDQGDILIGNDLRPLDTLAVNDSAMLFSNKSGNTALYKLRPGPRTSISVDETTQTITITALEQGGGPGTGVGDVSVGVLNSGDQQVRNFPAAGVSPGDIILATIDKDLEGITLTAYVRQAGKVDVVFFNGSGSTVSLGPVTVNFANFGQP